MAVGKQSKRKKTTAADLPEELVRHEILTRLPIKSVGRFKRVCKSWLSLFSSPGFVKDHLTRNTTQNPDDYDCLVAEKLGKILILSRNKEAIAIPTEFCFRLVGSVRGLVCLRSPFQFSLWNPAIHQFKEVPLLPTHYRPNPIGFGFDPVSDNYKVVLLPSGMKSATVYDSNSNSWIDVSIPRNVYPPGNGEGLFDFSMTIVKDCPYWKYTSISRDPQNLSVSLILMKFEVGSNEFKLLPEFQFDMSLPNALDAQLVDMNDCLNLIVYDHVSAKCMVDIYSLDGEEGCCVWSKLYSIGPLDFYRPHCSVSLSPGFNSGEIVFYDSTLFSCYDPKTDTIKHLHQTSGTAFVASVISCFRYTPSLVFLPGMKSVYLTTPTRRRTTGPCSTVPRRLINLAYE